MTTASASRLDATLLASLASEAPPAGAPGWRASLASEAVARLGALGLPSSVDEDFLYTDQRPLRTPFARRAGPPRGAAPLPDERLHLSPFAPVAVLVNGRLDLARSRVDSWLAKHGGAWLGRLTSLDDVPVGRLAATRDSAFAALNDARFVDGLGVRIPAGSRAVGPLLVVHSTAPDGVAGEASTYPRLFAEVGENAEAFLVEVFLADAEGPSLVAATTEIDLAPGARIVHLRLQLQGRSARHLGTTAARVRSGGSYRLVDVTFGGATHRHAIHVDLVEPSASSELSGLYVLRGSDHADTHAVVDHRCVGGTSRQTVKGILDDRSRGAFTGRVVVHPDAQRTEARQAHHALLLAEGARVNTRPQLEIHADDVQCAHGATVGQIDEEALFYLRSRAVSGDRARSLLIHAFAEEIVTAIDHEALAQDVHRLLAERLSGSHAATGDPEVSP